MKHIAILGSTGSIGENTLAVIRHFPKSFKAVALATHSNIESLLKQIKEFRPEYVCVADREAALKLRSRLKGNLKIFAGEEGLEELVSKSKADKVVLAISGSAALPPLLKAIENGKDIALANKEALVMAGPLVMKMASRNKIKILPIDSEQSAIWQCLEGEKHGNLKNIYLTASGGPFRKTGRDRLRKISRSQVLKHPKWSMGPKITVDSATLMNKGLEVLEAMFLFDVPCAKIKVLVHPEAIIHSMVEFIDGVVIAQLSETDMRIPIQYALSYPERLANSLPTIDFCKLKELHFEKPDFGKFPCLGLAYRAAAALGTSPAVLNAANEVSVGEFLDKRLEFISIPRVIDKGLDKHRNIAKPDLTEIKAADSWARQEAYNIIERLN